MGRPPIGRMVNVRMPAPLLAKLDARAAAEGITRAELLRRIAQEAMEGET